MSDLEKLLSMIKDNNVKLSIVYKDDYSAFLLTLHDNCNKKSSTHCYINDGKDDEINYILNDRIPDMLYDLSLEKEVREAASWEN